MSQCGRRRGGCGPQPSSGARPALLSVPRCGRWEGPAQVSATSGGCPGQPVRDAALRYSIISKRFPVLWAHPVTECEGGTRTSLRPAHLIIRRVKVKAAQSCPLFVTPWTTQSMEFSRPGYWRGWPFPSPGDLHDPGIKPGSPALGADSLPHELPGKLHRKRGFGNRGTPPWVAGPSFSLWALLSSPSAGPAAAVVRAGQDG